VRCDNNSKLQDSAPCQNCLTTILELNIKRIVFSYKDNTFISCNPKELTINHISAGNNFIKRLHNNTNNTSNNTNTSNNLSNNTNTSNNTGTHKNKNNNNNNKNTNTSTHKNKINNKIKNKIKTISTQLL
jgi:deoxycytidylate deaminase